MASDASIPQGTKPQPRERHTLHSFLLPSDVQYPRASAMQQWTQRNSRYVSYITPWKNCYFLHAAHAKPDFITDDIINKVKLFVVQEGHYQDPLSALKETVSDANVDLSDNDLEAIVSLMHENGTRWFKARLEDGLPFLLKPSDLQDDMVATRRRVRDELMERGVVNSKARDVAEAWCSKFQAVELQGRTMGHWSTSVCPWLYDKQKDAAKEKGIIQLFNRSGTWIDETITHHQGRSVLSKLRKRTWLHTGNTSIRPRTGANMTAPIGPGGRKPDAVLMDTTKPIDSIEWADIISALEIKYRNTKVLMEQAIEYMSEIARLVLTNQINRRYFVGLLLLGTDLFVCTYTRGGSSITIPIDIYHDVNEFLNCMAWFKHTDLEFLGYDKSIVRHSRGFKMALKGESESAHGTIADIVSVIYNSNSAIGRSTRILGLTYQTTSAAEMDNLIVKDVWQDIRIASDGDIHKLLEDSGRIDETRELLGSEFPERISKTPEEAKLTEELFQSWGIRPEWDDWNAEGMHPWHLPIRDNRFSVEALEMTDGNNGHQALDSVPVILQDMTTASDPLIHRRTVFRTPAVKCTWFSCRREFLHGVLDSLLGHLEACRRGIMHRDTSDSNVWFWVPQTEPQYAVPDWYISPQNSKPYFDTLEAPAPWFPKRPGMTGDFGLGLNMLDKTGAANAVTTTGTFPFGTTADLKEAPHITHDLESYIFLIWIVGVNFKGPYHQVEHWPPPPKAGPIPDNCMANDEASDFISSKLQLAPINWPGKGQRSSSVKRFSATQHTPAESVNEELERRNAIVPEWAKMGSLQLRTDTVLHQKRFLNYETFDLSLHPYWKVGKLSDGWRKLFNLLWPTQEDNRTIDAKRSSLTHAALVSVIREMILLIPLSDDGAPSREVVTDARNRYSSSISRLVGVERFKFVPPVLPYSHSSGTSIPPPFPNLSAQSSPSSYLFIEFNAGSMYRTSQKRPSDTSTSGPLPQARASLPQSAETSTGNAGSRTSGPVSNSSAKRRKA